MKDDWNNIYCAEKQITCPDGESLQGDRCVQDYVCIGAKMNKSKSAYYTNIKKDIVATTKKECLWKMEGDFIGIERTTWKEREREQKELETHERNRDIGPTE